MEYLIESAPFRDKGQSHDNDEDSSSLYEAENTANIKLRCLKSPQGQPSSSHNLKSSGESPKDGSATGPPTNFSGRSFRFFSRSASVATPNDLSSKHKTANSNHVSNKRSLSTSLKDTSLHTRSDKHHLKPPEMKLQPRPPEMRSGPGRAVILAIGSDGDGEDSQQGTPYDSPSRVPLLGTGKKKDNLRERRLRRRVQFEARRARFNEVMAAADEEEEIRDQQARRRQEEAR